MIDVTAVSSAQDGAALLCVKESKARARFSFTRVLDVVRVYSLSGFDREAMIREACYLLRV